MFQFAHYLTPFLLSISGGTFIGYFLFRPLASHLSRTESFPQEESHEIILIYARNSALILFAIFSVIAFARYGVLSSQATVTAVYFFFMMFAITWGVFMGMEKKFISSWNLPWVLKKL